MATHCGALIPKKELIEDISLEYIFFMLKMNLKSYATGEGNKRITVERMKDVKIDIPTKYGKYDINKQKELVKKYNIVNTIKSDTGNLRDKEYWDKIQEVMINFMLNLIESTKEYIRGLN